MPSGRQPQRFGIMRGRDWGDQGQLTHAEIAHRASGRPEIAGIMRSDQHHASGRVWHDLTRVSYPSNAVDGDVTKSFQIDLATTQQGEFLDFEEIAFLRHPQIG